MDILAPLLIEVAKEVGKKALETIEEELDSRKAGSGKDKK
jgi:hypothetical protein